MAKTPKQTKSAQASKTNAKASSQSHKAVKAMLRRRDIEAQIRYEEAPGIHTYHACPCGRGVCRGTKCAKCWKDALRGH